MTETSSRRDVPRVARKSRSDGERSRKAILQEAAQLATVEGLGGISIARLADAVGMSKSGLFAHFGSKHELQLATIETASALFSEQVIDPALAAPTAIDRLRQLTENYLRHIEARIYPGGCFFASLVAEMNGQSGPIRDWSAEFMNGWIALLDSTIRDAQADGAIDPAEDPAQLAYEIEAFLLLANAQFVVRQDSVPIGLARRALEHRLALATAGRTTSAACRAARPA
jgi:AcrR family transcriptional regulator